MKLAGIQRSNVVIIALVALVGCSTNKTGSNFNLAKVNPFQWIKPESETKPYPQKPSSFASPSDVAGKYPEAVASSTKTGTLPAVPSPQAYSATQTGYQTSSPATYPSTASSSSATPYGAMPSSYSPTARASAAPLSANPVTTTAWQSGPAGTATAIDDSSSTQTARQTSTGASVGGYPYADDSRQSDSRNLGLTRSSSNSGTTPANYNPYVPANQAQSQSNAAQGTSSVADWSALVGDRYARLYQNSGSAVQSQTSGPIGETGYTPGNTGYVPGQLENPPGNVNYQPGQTGYNPPGIPPYAVPYGTSGQQSSASGNTTSDVALPSGEYRPGSTKTYTPRTGTQISNPYVPSGESRIPPGSSSSFQSPGGLSANTSNLSYTDSVNTPFRM